MDLKPCPECELPAEVLDLFILESTDGPVEHVSLRCISGHTFTMPSPPDARRDHLARSMFQRRCEADGVREGVSEGYWNDVGIQDFWKGEAAHVLEVLAELDLPKPT